MYKDRRRRLSPPEEYVDGQLDGWRWDSHLWIDGNDRRYARCEWCGWVPPTEMPLSHAPLCLSNPAIKSHMQQLGDTVAKAFKQAMAGNKWDPQKKEDKDNGRG